MRLTDHFHWKWSGLSYHPPHLGATMDNYTNPDNWQSVRTLWVQIPDVTDKYYTPEAMAETVVAQTLGYLIGSQTVVEHYHSDFIRDAFWLKRQVLSADTHEPTYYWSADGCGTCLSVNPETAGRWRGDRVLHRIDMVRDDERQEIRVTVYWYTGPTH